MSSLKDNLKQLYYFYESVNSGSISAATKKLFISQPAISMQIKKLETCCGIKLIKENNRRILPTPEGWKLFKDLDKVFKLIDKAEADLKRMEVDKQPHIAIGATPTYNKFILPHIFESFTNLHPQCHIKTITDSSTTLLDSLKHNRVDIIVMALWKKLSLKNFQVYPLGREEVLLLSAPDHHLQQQPGIALKTLESEKFIMRDEKSGTRKYILRKFNHLGIKIPISIECEHPDLVKKLIMEGKGIGFLTKTKIYEELTKGLVKEVNLKGHKFYLDIAIVMNKHNNFIPEINDFVNCTINSKHKWLSHSEIDQDLT